MHENEPVGETHSHVDTFWPKLLMRSLIWWIAQRVIKHDYFCRKTFKMLLH